MLARTARDASSRCLRPASVHEEQATFGLRYNYVARRFVILGLAVGVAVVAAVLLYRAYAALQGNDQIIAHSGESPHPETLSAGWAEDNVREVQMKLREGGFYSGEIDGAYSSELALALARYQIRNGLPITGRLDVDTSEALGAKPAVTTMADDRARSSETWRRLRATIQPETQPIGSPSTESSTTNISTERLRDYIGAFVLAGLDPHVGSEGDFFADRVQYYDQGVMDREKIRNDLQRYVTRWPERRFWLAGDVTVEHQSGNRVRVTFPLRYELRNGARHLSGKVNKTLVLEPAGYNLAIVAVTERKAEQEGKAKSKIKKEERTKKNGKARNSRNPKVKRGN
jgi:peptidoglycan hydrolase-like protein with peptidoglycan-binding domain